MKFFADEVGNYIDIPFKINNEAGLSIDEIALSELICGKLMSEFTFSLSNNADGTVLRLSGNGLKLLRNEVGSLDSDGVLKVIQDYIRIIDKQNDAQPFGYCSDFESVFCRKEGDSVELHPVTELFGGNVEDIGGA